MADSATLPPAPTAEQIQSLKWLMNGGADVLAKYLARIKALDDLRVVVVSGNNRSAYAARWTGINGIVEIQV